MKLKKLLVIAVSVTVILAMCGAPAFAATKAPAKVTGVKVTKATNISISLSWKKAARAKTYEVQYKAAGTAKWKTAKTKARKLTLKNLKPNKKYSFKLRAINGKKKGKYSKTIAQKTFATPGKIKQASIFAGNRTSNNITLKWGAAANANYYEIDAYGLNGPSYGIQQSLTPSFDIVHQTRAYTWYKYRIRAINTKTGKFPSIKGAWSDYYYTCTTSGDRVITGTKNSYGSVDYKMSGTIPFRVCDDDGLIPTGYVDLSDEYGTNFVTDTLICSSVQFPSDFESSSVAGKTIKVGATFNGKKVSAITVEQEFSEDGPTGNSVVFLRYDGSDFDSFIW